MSLSKEILIKNVITPVGELILGSLGSELCLCDWRYRKQRTQIDQRLQKIAMANYKEGETVVIEQAEKELNEFFNEKRQKFTVPLLLLGSEFQKSVWQQLLKIPYGETVSYLALSKALGNEKAIRAVAAANGANALSILVPCHRVIGASGDLVGYAGGVAAKKKLLMLEGALQNGQTSLFG